MRTIYAIIIWICLLVLCSECDNLLVFVLSKLIAGVVILICGRLFTKTLTKQELEEEV